MPDAVPDQAHAALDEEETNRGREQADDCAGREGVPHEVDVKDGHGTGRASGRESGGRAVEDDSPRDEDEAFHDHWEHHPRPFDEWWRENRNQPEYDPTFWFVIRTADGEIAE